MFGSLLVIHKCPRRTQREITKIQQIDRTTMGQIIDQLEARKLVVRKPFPGDRRAYHLVLTDEGEALTVNLWATMKACESEWMGGLSDAKAQKFSLTLAKLIPRG